MTHDDLRKAAEAATPGPWSFVSWKDFQRPHYRVLASKMNVARTHGHSLGDEQDAEYIALANPARILALLDDLAAKDARIAELLAALVATPVVKQSFTTQAGASSAKTPGQIAYEERREDYPNYISGRPKPEWGNLSSTDRGFWECRAAHEAEARARDHATDMLRTLREIAEVRDTPAGKAVCESDPYEMLRVIIESAKTALAKVSP